MVRCTAACPSPHPAVSRCVFQPSQRLSAPPRVCWPSSARLHTVPSVAATGRPDGASPLSEPRPNAGAAAPQPLHATRARPQGAGSSAASEAPRDAPPPRTAPALAAVQPADLTSPAGLALEGNPAPGDVEQDSGAFFTMPAVPQDVLDGFENKLGADTQTVVVTLSAILGVIVFWRGVWALLDRLVGDSVPADLCCAAVGLGIVLYIRLSGLKTAAFWPPS